MTNRNPMVTVQKVENGYMIQTREKTWIAISAYSMVETMEAAFAQAELESVHTEVKPLSLDRWSIHNAAVDDKIPSSP